MMRVEKHRLMDLKRCYATGNLPFAGEDHLVFASEDPGVGCELFNGEDFSLEQELWKEAGGCMGIVPIPETDGDFLAVQEFYLKVSPSLAKIVYGQRTEKGYICTEILSLPYIHRFGILRRGGINYWIGATIAEAKDHKEDWSRPGKVYWGIVPASPAESMPIHELCTGLFRNHGFWVCEEEGIPRIYIGSDQGIERITPPEALGGDFCVEHVMDGRIGEVATIDLDGDGMDELMTIEPFHGNALHIYKKSPEGYERIYTYPETIDFAHALIGDTLCGIPTFLAGVRREEAELVIFQWRQGSVQAQVLERGVGPANLAVVHQEDRDLILSANHTANEVAVYVCTEASNA